MLRQLLTQLAESLHVLPFTHVAQSVTLALYVSSLPDFVSQLLSQVFTSTFVGLHMLACSQTMLQFVCDGSRLGPLADEQAARAIDATTGAAKKSELRRFMDKGSSHKGG